MSTSGKHYPGGDFYAQNSDHRRGAGGFGHRLHAGADRAGGFHSDNRHKRAFGPGRGHGHQPRHAPVSAREGRRRRLRAACGVGSGYNDCGGQPAEGRGPALASGPESEGNGCRRETDSGAQPGMHTIGGDQSLGRHGTRGPGAHRIPPAAGIRQRHGVGHHATQGHAGRTHRH